MVMYGPVARQSDGSFHLEGPNTIGREAPQGLQAQRAHEANPRATVDAIPIALFLPPEAGVAASPNRPSYMFRAPRALTPVTAFTLGICIALISSRRRSS